LKTQNTYIRKHIISFHHNESHIYYIAINIILLHGCHVTCGCVSYPTAHAHHHRTLVAESIVVVIVW